MKAASWEKAKNIFEQAMAVAPGERGRFLDEVCLDDEIVRREVEELLSSFDETASFLETPAVSKKKNELARFSNHQCPKRRRTAAIVGGKIVY
jgi:hypothetical protein